MMSDMRREQHAGPLGVAIVDNDVCALDMMGLLIDRIRPPMTVLWKAVRAQDALEHCLFDERLPDVLVLDLALNGISGVDVCRAIRAKNGTIGIIGVSSYPLEPYRERMAEAGAQALFNKTQIRSRTFEGALRRAGSGVSVEGFKDFMTASTAHERLAGTRQTAVSLSRRELDVLRLYAQGMTTDEVCIRLNITANTALSHVNHVAHKLGVRRRTEAIRACQAMHLLD